MCFQNMLLEIRMYRLYIQLHLISDGKEKYSTNIYANATGSLLFFFANRMMRAPS